MTLKSNMINEKVRFRINEIRNIIKKNCCSNRFLKLILKYSLSSFHTERALSNFERFLEAYASAETFSSINQISDKNIRALSFLFSGSDYLSDLLISNPQYIIWLLSERVLWRTRFKDTMRKDIDEMVSSGTSYEQKIKQVKQFKNKEYLRLGLRDLLKEADTVEVLEDISNVADLTSQKAYDLANEKLIQKFGTPMYQDENSDVRPCEFSVLGMGKLGGRELNFSSDIDLIYVYRSDRGKTTGKHNEGNVGQISNHEFFSMLAREITRILNEVTEDGRLYRVDLDLRPEGKSGNITNSLRSMEIYYESWGETWERQMLIKTRAIAGSIALGEEFRNLVRPFVYRKYLDFSALKEIKNMKDKINRNLSLKGVGEKDNVKLGEGGIREAEFIIQSFQLVYGGKISWLRERNTLRELHRISEKGLLSYSEYSDITRAALFLRDLENRIQMNKGLQNHIIPEDIPERAVLARKMGFWGDSNEELVNKLMQEYRKHTIRIHEIYTKLFSSEIEETDNTRLQSKLTTRKQGRGDEKAQCSEWQGADSGDGEVAALNAAWNNVTEQEARVHIEEEEETKILLKESGFREIDKSYKTLLLLKEGAVFAHPTYRSKELFETLLPSLLSKIKELPDPDFALFNFEKFIDAGRVRDMVYKLLSNNLFLVNVLCSLFGNSIFLSNILIQQPELIDYLIDVKYVLKKKSKKTLRRLFLQGTEQVEYYAAALDRLRKLKRIEELHIGINEILENFTLEETFTSLSNLADIYIEFSLNLVNEELKKKYGSPEKKKKNLTGFALFGLGKLGGKELNYGSDLDLIFVYAGDGETSGGSEGSIQNYLYYTKLCEKLIQAVAGGTRYGFGYKVDTRLRPEGEKGVLVMSYAGYEKYYETRASIWERQALIKCRFIAGSKEVGKEFIRFAEKTVYGKSMDNNLGKTIYEMRKKMEKERAGNYDLKVGKGGIVDIEFAVQYLQMKWGWEHPQIRGTKTLESLRTIQALNLVEQNDLSDLINGYLFLRKIELKLRMYHDQPVNRLPTNDAQLEGLVKRMGKRGENIIESFLAEFEEVTTRVRNAFENIFR